MENIRLKLKIIIIFLIIFLGDKAFVHKLLAADLHVGVGQTYLTIQEAVNNANCGDTIYIHAGTYNEQVEINNKQCSSSTVTTIMPYSLDEVVINAPANRRAIYIRGTTRYWIIDGKNQMIINGASSVDGVIRIAYSSGSVVGVQIKNCIINANNPSGAGIILTATDNCLIEGNTFTGTFYRGIEGSSAGTAPLIGDWRLIIRKNICSNPGYACFEASGTSYWLIEKNYCYVDKPNLQHLIVHRGGTNWKIQNNIFEIRSGGSLNSIAVLRSDVSYSGYNISNEIYINNTFAITGGSVSNGYGVVFFAWPDGTYSHENVRFQNNLFLGNFRTTNGIFQWGSGNPNAQNCFINDNLKTALDSDSIWGNPIGYTLSNNITSVVNYIASGNKPSPYFDLINSYDGSSLNNPPIDDFDGNLRSFPPDIGAFEFEGILPDTTPPAAPRNLRVN